MSLRHAALLAALPPGFSLTLVDVGSAGGVHPRWRPYRKVVSAVMFDPREEARRGGLGPGDVRTYPVALGSRPGEATLHLTRLANMSSFLEPAVAALERFGKKVSDAQVVATEQVPVETLDAIARADAIRSDVIKVDTQGSELLVLEGAQEALRSTLVAEVEVSFITRYRDQPLFGDVEAYMRERGFELVDLMDLKRYRAANGLRLRNIAQAGQERSGQLAYANALFVRPERWVADAARHDDGVSLLRAVCALCAYRKVDIAARLLDVGGEALGHAARNLVGEALRALARPWSAPASIARSIVRRPGRG